jgi:hypothetical protein
MNAMRKALEDFLANSTPEQLEAELSQGYRPRLQEIDDPALLVEEPKFNFPATVSFFRGQFAQEDSLEILDTGAPPYAACTAAGGLALAA